MMTAGGLAGALVDVVILDSFDNNMRNSDKVFTETITEYLQSSYCTGISKFKEIIHFHARPKCTTKPQTHVDHIRW